MEKRESFGFGCCVIVNPHLCDLKKIVCSVNSEVKMAQLWLGVGVKVKILVSHLHPKNLISKAYPNHTKTDKGEGQSHQYLFIMRKRLLLFFIIPQEANRQKSLIVGPSITLFTSLKKEKKKGSFLHTLVVVATILEKMAGHNKTPTMLTNHQEMRKMSLQRLCICWRQQQAQLTGMVKIL